MIAAASSLHVEGFQPSASPFEQGLRNEPYHVEDHKAKLSAKLTQVGLVPKDM